MKEGQGGKENVERKAGLGALLRNGELVSARLDGIVATAEVVIELTYSLTHLLTCLLTYLLTHSLTTNAAEEGIECMEHV